jgi:hypothetical protein
MANWLALTKPHLNMKFGSAKTVQTRIIERPGLWMTDDELASLSGDLRKIIDSLEIGGLDYGVGTGERESLNNAIITLVYDGPTGRPVAFNALRYMPCSLRNSEVQVVHLGLVIVDPTYRAKGLSWILYGLTIFLLFFKGRLQPLWVSNVTQVPAIIGMVSEGFSEVFPNPKNNNRRTYDHLLLARQIMSQHRAIFGVGPEAEFDPDNFIIKNAYTGGSDNLKKTFAQAPQHRNPIYNEFCQANLDYDRGDDILQLGQVKMGTFLNYIAHSTPASSILFVLYQALFTLLEGLVVPLFQWLQPSQAMGLLRPWKSREAKK